MSCGAWEPDKSCFFQNIDGERGLLIHFGHGLASGGVARCFPLTTQI
jgi:hypothetical protein